MAARLTAIGCAMLVGAASHAVQAQAPGTAGDYPNKPIRMIVHQDAGSAGDNSARVMAPPRAEALGQPVIVENRPGAGGAIGMRLAAAATPNGYTVIAVGSPIMVLPYVHKDLGYDLFRDFAGIGRYSISHNALVVPPGVQAGSVKELIALAKAKPGQLNMATAGMGSASHLAGMLFNALADIQALVVPYKGGGAAITSLIAGETQYYVTPLSAVLGQVRTGRLKALGVGGERRVSQLPDVPTIAEAGVPSYQSVGWGGMLAPRGTPSATMARLMDKLAAIMALAAVQQQLVKIGVEPSVLLGAEFEQFMREDLERFGIAARAANLKPN
ncbi:MAG: tripartite tricarboxylate transporter substrate binding protein [Burkholderiales bacterium]|nr:tripartite tricarboxylate transporter substrate binding protein [Burkholderiales bacterium]